MVDFFQTESTYSKLMPMCLAMLKSIFLSKKGSRLIVWSPFYCNVFAMACQCMIVRWYYTSKNIIPKGCMYRDSLLDVANPWANTQLYSKFRHFYERQRQLSMYSSAYCHPTLFMIHVHVSINLFSIKAQINEQL